MHAQTTIRGATALLCTALLSGCFVSVEPIIPAGATVLPIDHKITLCVDAPDDCFDMQVEGDGYRTLSDVSGEESGAARFSPLAQIQGQQIYLIEAHDLEDDAYTFLAARRRTPDEESAGTVQLALIVCSDLNDAQRAAFVEAGGEIRDGWGDECIPPDLETLKAAILAAYSDDFADDTWWAAGGAD